MTIQQFDLLKLEAITAIQQDLENTVEAFSVTAENASALAIAANAAAEAAASASGDVLFYDTKSAANAVLSGLSEGQIVEVMADESVSGLRTRYRVTSGAYVFKIILGEAKVSSISALRAIPYSAILTTAQTLGVNAAGDGGGGTWRWDANSTAADNVGTVVLPTGHATAGRWRRIYNSTVQSLWFGVDTTGATSANALLTTINAFDLPVELAPGTYLITADLELHDQWRLNGDVKFSVNTGIKLTLNGDIPMERRQFFDGAGSIILAGRPERTIYPEWWGAQGDSTLTAGTGTDDATALRRMQRTFLYSDWDVHWVLDLQAGSVYRYTDNRWARANKLTLNGNGAYLRNESNNVWDFNKFPFVYLPVLGSSIFNNVPDSEGGTRHYGYALGVDALAGSSSITLASAPDASNFFIGQRVVVYGRQAQNGGYPPWATDVDYAVVTNVAGAVITIDPPVTVDYYIDAALGLYVTPDPEPKIVPLDRKDGSGDWLAYFGTYFGANNINVLDNPNIAASIQYFMIGTAWNVEIDEASVTHFVPTELRQFTFSNSKTDNPIDFDKFMFNGRFENCIMYVPAGAGPSNLFEAVNCHFVGSGSVSEDKLSIHAKTQRIQGCTFTNSYFSLSSNVVKSVFINGNTFINPPVAHPISSESQLYIALTAGSYSNTDDYTFTINYPADYNQKLAIGTLAPGDVLLATAIAGGGRYASLANQAVVESVADNGAGTAVVITAKFPFPVIDNDRLYVFGLKNFIASGNRYDAPYLPPAVAGLGFLKGVELQVDNWVDSKKLTYDFYTYRNSPVVISFPGYWKSISFDVYRPYTGAETNAMLILTAGEPTYAKFTYKVDLKKAGTRHITPAAAYGKTTNDVLPVVDPTYLCSTSYIASASDLIGNVVTTFPSDTDEKLARFKITVEFI